MTSACLFFLAGNLAAQAQAGALGAPPNYQKGVASFQQKRYSEAISYFMESATNENGGANAWLYIAHCYYATAQRGKAKETYKMVSEVYPGTSQATIAASYLKALTPAATTGTIIHGSSKTGKGSVTSPTSTSLNSVASTSTTKPAVADEVLFDKRPLEERIELIIPRMNHPEVSTNTIREMKGFVAALPPQVKALLNKRHLIVTLTPTMIDFDRTGEHQEIIGYEGNTSKSSPSMLSGLRIVVAEHVVDEQTNEVLPRMPYEQMQQYLQVATGYAVNFAMGYISKSEPYKHAYELDKAALPEATVNRLRFYLQPDELGRQRVCGLVLAHLMGCNRGDCNEISSIFPETAKYLKAQVGL